MNSAVILAAGESRRMQNSPKANLVYQGRTFLNHIVSIMNKAGIGQIIVVLGCHIDSVKEQHASLPVKFIVNSEYKSGQLSSIKASLKVISGDTKNLIVHPVDHPLIQTSTVKALLSTRQNTNAPVVIPVYRKIRGHPVLFGSEVFQELADASPDVGAREVVWDHNNDFKEVSTDDEGILININTHEDYEKWCNKEL